MKTIEEIVDENPDRSPEEHGEMFAAQSDGPEQASPAKMPSTMGLDVSPKPMPKLGLEISTPQGKALHREGAESTQYRRLATTLDTNVQPLPRDMTTVNDAASDKDAGKYALLRETAKFSALSNTPGKEEIAARYPDSLPKKPVTETDLPEEVATAPSNPVEMEVAPEITPPRVAEKARVAKLYSDRNALEEGLQKDIESNEDAIKTTHDDSRTESALAAGGKVLAGTLGNMLKYDSKPQVQGFEDAQKSIAARTDPLRQRREFLKERLYRADNPTKRALDDLKMRGAVRGESLADEMDPLTRQNALSDAEADIQDNENRYAKGQGVAKAYDRNSPDFKKLLFKDIVLLRGLAGKDGPNKEVAEGIIKDPSEFNEMNPDNRKKYMDDLFKADKDGKKWEFKTFKAGTDKEGYGAFNPETKEFTVFDQGARRDKVPTGRTGKQITDDNLRRDYEKEYSTGVRIPQGDIAKTRQMFEIAKTNPEAVGVLQYNIARSIAGEKGPLSNMDVQRAALASPQIVDGILQTLETRGFGALTDGQKDTLERLLTEAEKHLKAKGANTQARYKVRAGEVGANERYIFGEDVENTPVAPPASKAKSFKSADELPEL